LTKTTAPILTIVLISSLFLFFSLPQTALAQEENQGDETEGIEEVQDDEPEGIKKIFSDNITSIMVAGIAAMAAFTGGMITARHKGKQLSADAAEAFFQTAKSIVENQNRWIWRELRDNRQRYEKLDESMGMGGKRIPLSLLHFAKKQVMNELGTELLSNRFTRTDKSILKLSMSSIVERVLTEVKKESSEKRRKFVKEMSSMVVSSALLKYKTFEEIKEKEESIINNAMDSLIDIAANEGFEIEHTLFENSIKAEFERRLREFQKLENSKQEQSV